MACTASRRSPPASTKSPPRFRASGPPNYPDTVLELGRTSSIDMTMAMASAHRGCVGHRRVVADHRRQGQRRHRDVHRSTIERMPKGRDFTTILRQAPGAQDESKSGGTQIDGASGSENRFIIDGMDTTNLQTGVSGKTMLLDFVEEVQVKSSGYNAEFGGATGGVVNVLTKSGINAFHGQAGTYYQIGRLLWRTAPVRAVQSRSTRTSQKRDCSIPTTMDLLQPGCGHRRPDPQGSAVVLRRRAPTPRTRTRTMRSSAPMSARRSVISSAGPTRSTTTTTSRAQLTNNIRVKFAGSNQRNGQPRHAAGAAAG